MVQSAGALTSMVMSNVQSKGGKGLLMLMFVDFNTYFLNPGTRVDCPRSRFTCNGNVPLSFFVQMVRSAGALASKVVSNIQGEVTAKALFCLFQRTIILGWHGFGWIHGSLCCRPRKVGLVILCYGFAEMDRIGWAQWAVGMPACSPQGGSAHSGGGHTTQTTRNQCDYTSSLANNLSRHLKEKKKQWRKVWLTGSRLP